MQLQEAETSTKLQIGGIVLFLALYAMLSSYLQHRHFPVHRGAVAAIVGMVVGFIIQASSSSTYNKITKMDQTLIFLILLPAMLFAKGYTFKKGAFVRNIKYIVLFGIIGTFLSYLIVTSLIYAANQLNLVRDSKDINNFRTLSLWEVLLLSACMCSIDTVASQEAVDQNKFPKLNAIIVGEDISKDCVTIVLFRSLLRLQNMETPSKFIFYWYTPFQTLFNFVILIVGSFVVGILTALITTYLFKKMRFFLNDNGITETTVLFLLGFATYVLAECIYLSGIVSILCYGVILNKYNYFNLSTGGQVSSKNTFLFVSNICEGLMFLIMGIMVWEVEWDQQSPDNPITHSYVFCFIVLLILLAGRFFNIIVLYAITKVIKPTFKLKMEEIVIIFIAGIARGATPFALFTSVEFLDNTSKYAKNEGLVLKTTIIIIVMLCTIFLNSIIPIIFKKPLKKLKNDAREYLILKSHEAQQSNSKLNQMAKSYFKNFDQQFLKPSLIYNYQIRKTQIQSIKRKLKQEHLKKALEQLQQEGEKLDCDDNKQNQSLLSN